MNVDFSGSIFGLGGYDDPKGRSGVWELSLRWAHIPSEANGSPKDSQAA